MKRDPGISIVVVVYNIPREAARTLYSLSPAYQRNVAPDDYEVIVVDNGSTPPVDEQIVRGFGDNFHVIRPDPASSSPASAVNRGLGAARGDIIGVMIDGARIVTPGLVHFARHAAELDPNAVVVTLGWYLGADYQGFAIDAGYDKGREDALLAQIDWPEDGYRLFEIATPDECSGEGWLHPLGEANALFLRRRQWNKLGGMDEHFDLPGGGFVNPDTYRRAMELPDAQLVLLLGEGTFHQVHGGVSTNATREQLRQQLLKWDAQYEALRGHPFDLLAPAKPTIYVGTMPRPVLDRITRAAVAPIRSDISPLGDGFDYKMWSAKPLVKPKDPLVAELLELAHQEFVNRHFSETTYVARIARRIAPDEPEPQRLLAMTATALALDEPVSANFYCVAGEAHRLLNEVDVATTYYHKALVLDSNFWQAHMGLASLRLPGEIYYRWLERFYQQMAPNIVMEIGVADGASLALIRRPTVAIGVDPHPAISCPLHAETHIFAETSDQFFSRRAPEAILARRDVDVAFIDGLHLFEQALRDFKNVERYCGRNSVILLHDTLPLDERTQSRARDTRFHTGDVWRTVMCLKHYRQDLNIFTIATPWTGLTVITGLDRESTILENRYEEAVAKFSETSLSEVQPDIERHLNVVPNDRTLVESRLKQVGVL